MTPDDNIIVYYCKRLKRDGKITKKTQMTLTLYVPIQSTVKEFMKFSMPITFLTYLYLPFYLMNLILI